MSASPISLQSGYVHKLKKAWVKQYAQDDVDQDSSSNQENPPDNDGPSGGGAGGGGSGSPAAGPPPRPPGSPSASSQLSSSSSSAAVAHKFKKLNAFRISSNKVGSLGRKDAKCFALLYGVLRV